MTSANSSSVNARGFSQKTCLPALNARAVSSAWLSCGVAITTMSMFGFSIASSIEHAVAVAIPSASRVGADPRG